MPEWSPDEPESDDPVAQLRAWAATAAPSVEVLPGAPGDGQRALEALGLSPRSVLGAVAGLTGGILVDSGWLRILGAGSPGLPRAIDRFNGLPGAPRRAEGLLVADDVLGGFFSWERASRTVAYLAPDTMEWEDLEVGYADWLRTMLSDRFATFYADLRAEAGPGLPGPCPADEVWLSYPPLWAVATEGRSWRRISLEEAWRWQTVQEARLRDVPDGTSVTVGWDEE